MNEDDSIIKWLLESTDPSIRYFTLINLLDRSTAEAEVQAAQRTITKSEPVKKILAAQKAEGYWVKPGAGYSPKYQATGWQILFLAELGADRHNGQVRRGCEYLLDHSQASHGGFSALAGGVPSGAIHCLNGNLIRALISLGYNDDERVQRAVEWLAGAATGDGFAVWNSIVPGPGFTCGANQGQPCAWGVVKALRALNRVPAEWQSPRVKQAKQQAAEFLLSRDLASADYPYRERISGEWFRFGFPLSYTSDVLEAALALVEAGCGRDPRLKPAIDLISSKRAADGRWAMKHSLNGKMWADIEAKGMPSKWITLRALQVLKSSN